jgi:hypothetical protein
MRIPLISKYPQYQNTFKCQNTFNIRILSIQEYRQYQNSFNMSLPFILEILDYGKHEIVLNT